MIIKVPLPCDVCSRDTNTEAERQRIVSPRWTHLVRADDHSIRSLCFDCSKLLDKAAAAVQVAKD